MATAGNAGAAGPIDALMAGRPVRWTVPDVSRRPHWLPEWDDDSTTANNAPPTLAELASPREVVRAFGFIDLCGFTAFTDRVGPVEACRVLISFRQLIRDVAAWRGIRVAKWLGDGVLLIGTDVSPLVACVVDVVARVQAEALDVRGGVSVGPALLIDGEDYVGRAVNLASRLCDLADAGEVLVDRDARFDLPSWIVSDPHPPVVVKGIGERTDLATLRPAAHVPVEPWPLPA